MTAQLIVSLGCALTGLGCVIVAIVHERRMQRHRRPGVTYADVTLRRDGAWKRDDLFTDVGLAHQQRASTFGVTGALFWIAGLVSWILLRGR